MKFTFASVALLVAVPALAQAPKACPADPFSRCTTEAKSGDQPLPGGKPGNFYCGTVGSVKNPQPLAGGTAPCIASSVLNCAKVARFPAKGCTGCSDPFQSCSCNPDNPAGGSFSYNTTSKLCTVYRPSVRAQGFKRGKTGITYYNTRACFNSYAGDDDNRFTCNSANTIG